MSGKWVANDQGLIPGSPDRYWLVALEREKEPVNYILSIGTSFLIFEICVMNTIKLMMFLLFWRGYPFILTVFGYQTERDSDSRIPVMIISVY